MPWKKKRTINERLIIITATLLVLTLTLLGYYWSQYRESDILYKKIEQIAFNENNTNGNKDKNDNTGNNEKPASLINHAALTARNKDYIGWLQVDGTDISYPIVQSKEALFYLRRDFNKQHSIAGTVFMDYQNNKDFTDTNTMIYGHNMHNGSMFASLKKFLKKDFFEANKFITISTPAKVLRYEIFSLYEVKATKVPYRVGIFTEQELTTFLKQVKDLQLYSRAMTVTSQDNILTLATCGYNIRDSRIIIHAKRVSD